MPRFTTMSDAKGEKAEESHLKKAIREGNGDLPLTSAQYKEQGEAALRELAKRDAELRMDANKASHTLQGLNSLERCVKLEGCRR